jgi:hypothetical protein
MANVSHERGSPSSAIVHRLHRLQLDPAKRRAFEDLLSRVLQPIPVWSIDQNDQNNYFVRFKGRSGSHSSDGAGEGLLSAIYLVDALYDSSPGQAIIIDEPELSLHPAIQRRLCELFLEYSSSRQIVIATHSPYFLPLEAVPSGASVARVFDGGSGSTVKQLSPEVGRRLASFSRDLNNPHVLGLDAREVFFLDDGVVLVEGQEDVVFYRRMAELLSERIVGSFFGWGVGGAEKMQTVAALLQGLGFERVAGVLDGNKAPLRQALEKDFPNYKFFLLPTDDVRSKPAIKERTPTPGLFDEKGAIRTEFEGDARALLRDLNAAVAPPTL